MRIRAGKALGLSAWVACLGCGAGPGAETASDLQRASLGEPALAALVVGCWELSWEFGDVGGPDVGQPPDSVRLRDETVFGTRERLVAPATEPSGRSLDWRGGPSWEAQYVLNRWWIEDGELRIRFSDGARAEWNVTFAVDPQELLGAARYRGDPEPRDGPLSAGVRAARFTCGF